MPELEAARTALVLIDLQRGILGMPLQPRDGARVMAAATRLADRFRAASAPVVLVNVAWAPDFADAPRQPVDNPHASPPGQLPEDWSDIAPGLQRPGDIRVTKHQWGAFYGTDLDVQLRRRNVSSVVVGGVATNMGVESTVRQAWERNYAVVVAEDVTSSLSSAMHEFAVGTIFPFLARVALSNDIMLR